MEWKIVERMNFNIAQILTMVSIYNLYNFIFYYIDSYT